jgi:glucose/arabinose dehydrogenase
MSVMQRSMIALAALLCMAACAKREQAAQDTTKIGPAASPPPAATTLADFAGKWQMAATPLAGKDTTTVKYTLTATADTSGWMIEFPTGVKAPLRVMLSGDSVMVKTGEFASQRRKNAKVWNDGWVRLEAGKLVGVGTAHYVGAGADSLLKQRIEGTRMP